MQTADHFCSMEKLSLPAKAAGSSRGVVGLHILASSFAAGTT